MRKTIRVVVVLLLAAAGALAQSNPTATLTGKVTADGAPLPGVIVTATSPRMQGERRVVTTAAGDYIIPFLPPGPYVVTFEMAGLETVTETLTLTAARTDTVSVELVPAKLEEEITITAERPMTATIEATEVSTNFDQDLIDLLPVGRTLQAVTLLAPGVNAGGPSDNIVISGAMSYDSLYLVNGTIVNENLRGQPHDLFIEDAIEETTVFTGGISAEYGHFTGGVVNMLTKSGGNDFRGSFRTTLNNESWRAKTPLTAEQEDKINPVYEATFGGPILRDRLWFFTAARYAETDDIQQTGPGLALAGDQDASGNPVPVGDPLTPITYPHGTEERRLEAKLTGALTTSHRVIGSYIDIDESETNQRYTSAIMDLDSLVEERKTPNTLMALNYSGVLSSNVFVEAQYSKKTFQFVGSGSPYFDIIKGTLVQDRARATRYWSPTFRATDDGERRDHRLYTVKGSYFLSSESLGSHEIKAGYERFEEVRKVNNYQNGSDFRISLSRTIVRGDQVFPYVRNTSTYTRIYWYPIFVLSRGSEYASDSFFINDRWVYNDRVTFNLGLRYDKNDAMSGDGKVQIADDSAYSPRVAVNWDVLGNGRLTATASFGQYVGRLAEGVGNDADPAGRNASFGWNYRGPAINTDLNAPTSSLIPTEVALQMIFDWFFANGGTDLRPFRSAPSVPGIESILDPNGLKSPNVKEWTIGMGAALGTRGYFRGDFVHRNWDDFYVSKVNMGTGKVTDDYGTTYDQAIITNDSGVYDRKYYGIQTQYQYRLSDRWNFGGTYTWSQLIGNVTGETWSSGPVVGVATERPEYRQERWNYPTGYLTGDRRNRAKLWATYDMPTGFGNFTWSLLQSFESGTASSSEGTIDPSPYVENPGYEDVPTGISYFFGGRGNVKSDDITRTDISLNYKFPVKGIDIFLQAELFNIFNERGVVSFNEEVLTNDDVDYLAAFNPFTDDPIECPQGASSDDCEAMGANWQKGVNFGKPESEGDYQTPRTFRVSIGFRF